jgi:hypothetical protein
MHYSVGFNRAYALANIAWKDIESTTRRQWRMRTGGSASMVGLVL